MKTRNKLMLSTMTLAVLSALNQASAQDAGDSGTKPAVDAVAKEVAQVVVTGTSQSGGVRKIDASFSITTASEEMIKQVAPTSTADLLKIVPGLTAEPTGGSAAANIAVRGFPSTGDAPFVTIQLMGSPIFPVPTLGFMENSALFRIDDTVERVEVLRGGPSTIYSNGQPGATVNFLLKRGYDEPEGSMRLTLGTHQLRRYDGFYSGKLADNWFASIGGFYRISQGVRDGQFPADDGGQLTATLTRKLDNGELTMYVRRTDEKNAFYTGVPLVAAKSPGDQPTGFPGFDPLTGTALSNELRNVILEVGNGKTVHKDLARGRGVKGTVLGADFTQKFDGWTVSNKFNHFSANAPTLGIFTGNAPLALSTYIANAIRSANANPAIVAAAGRAATSGVATYAADGKPADTSQQVMSPGIWSIDKDVRSTTNDFRLSKEVVKDHTVTAGLYLANYSVNDLWYVGNNTLMTATSNARPISVRLDNGVVVAGNGGRDGGVTNALNASYNGRNTAVFLSDEWTINSKVRVDAGIRQESQRINGTIANRVTGDADANLLTVYNNSTMVATANNTGLTRKDNAFSYTLGGNYKVSKDFAIFARANSGHAFPTFEGLRTKGTQANVNDRAQLPLVDVKQYEIGLKTAGQLYSAYLTFFRNDFTGLSFSQLLADGSVRNNVAGSNATGLEFETSVRPIQDLQITLSGNYQDAKFKNFGTRNGNRVLRQPKLQFRLTPSYQIMLGDTSVRLYATYTSIGERFADIDNLQVLPKYHKFDAGLVADLSDRLEFRLTANNLTNEFGLTEGNSRIIGSGGSTVFGRPLFGRSAEASIAYRF